MSFIKLTELRIPGSGHEITINKNHIVTYSEIQQWVHITLLNSRVVIVMESVEDIDFLLGPIQSLSKK